MPAIELRRLSGIYRRSTKDSMPRSSDQGVQRRLDGSRSDEIAEYVQRGYPWSTLSKQKRASGDFDDLVKPGWLPTGIVVNVLRKDDVREGRPVHSRDVMSFRDSDGRFDLVYPEKFDSDWSASENPPIEVIDGQHRLWSFSETDDSLADFEVPVIAFSGLDIGWQAYLFYTINIKPKRINTSLAFDLYPLLRTADWLERAEEHAVYRETRAQELVEALWSSPSSPWHERIDMLGEHGRRFVTQAAWIRSLLASVVKSFEGKGVRIGGLFGALDGEPGSVLGWSRSQQAAFLIYFWSALREAIANGSDEWAEALRDSPTLLELTDYADPAFDGQETLLNTDQGLRGVLRVLNDLCVLRVDELGLHSWHDDSPKGDTTNAGIENAIDSLADHKCADFLNALAETLASWDWRSSKAPGLTPSEKQLKSTFRGGTGYKEIRLSLLRFLVDSGNPEIASASAEALGAEA